jgi:uncharacterized damage-inducible protein DinB
MLPDQARFLFEFLLPQLESEKAITQKILSSVPLESGGYRPAPESKSALELVRHIAICEIWFLDAIIHRRFEEDMTLPERVTTCADVAEWYGENFQRRIPILKTLSDEDLATEVDYIGLRNDPAVAYLNIAIRHSVHHRGQLSAYLRPMGARVPAIYVESADEPYPAIDGNEAAEERRPPAF